MEPFKLALYALGGKLEYLPLLVAIMVIFSTAFFGFVLPKYFDYNHGRNQRLLKNALDIEKGLKERHKNRCGDKYFEPDLDKIIDHFKKKYIKGQLEIVDKETLGQKTNDSVLYWQTIGIIAGAILVIGTLSILILALLRLSFS